MAPPARWGIVSLHEVPPEVYSNELSVAGVAIQSLLFGLCLATTGLCLYYLIRRRTQVASTYVIISFLLLLAAYNIVGFATTLIKAIRTFHWVLGFLQDPPITGPLTDDEALGACTIVFIPTFLWISDAFLIWRCWIVWIGRRWIVIIPGIIWFISVVTGIVWGIKGNQSVYAFENTFGPSTHLTDAVVDWIPSLCFSCGLDVITTSLIAGRLGYYHYRQRKFLSSIRGDLYSSVITIVIESAVMSTSSKFLQLFVPGVKSYSSAVIPLCTIASSLILLRKVLSPDGGNLPLGINPNLGPPRTQARGGHSISTFVAALPSNQSSTHTRRSIYSRFDAQLLEALGGPSRDLHVESGQANAVGFPVDEIDETGKVYVTEKSNQSTEIGRAI